MYRIILLNFFILLILISCKNDTEDLYTEMTINASITNVSDYGLNDGAIDLLVEGGEEPYLFQWSDNSTTEDIFDLCCGQYSVRISDTRNNIIYDTFMVSQPDAIPIIVEFTVENPTSATIANGSVQATVSGGYEPFTLKWNNGENTPDLNNLSAGVYTLFVEDSRGQTILDSIILTDYVLTDVDGNTYSVVKIGDQVWMKENLRVSHAPDNAEIESFVYNNNAEFENTYGRLYSWDAAMNGSEEEGAQGICPCGWHIPSDEEYKLLEIALGMSRAEADQTNTWRGATVGTQLIAGGSSGFEALLSGRASSPTRFSLMGRMEYYWTSSEYGNNAWRRCLDIYANDVGRWNTFPKYYGFSIRCVKDK